MVKRKADGTFEKGGDSPNPGGKSAEREELRRWLRADFGRNSIMGIAKLAGLIEGEKQANSELVRIDALKWLGEQSIGKPSQAITGANDGALKIEATAGMLEMLDDIQSKSQ